MTALQRLLLTGGLAPLLLMALVAGLNLRQSVSLRVLVWRSPALPLGAWIAIAAGGGCALSCLAGLALRPGTPPLQRQVHRRQEADRPEAGWADMPWPGPEPQANHRATPFPDRDLRDPAPTVSVPYRVIQRGTGRAAEATGVSPSTAASKAASSTATASSPAPRAASSDDDDWSAASSEDW
jgi:hypothetical protein